jgi:hypothetical protein
MPASYTREDGYIRDRYVGPVGIDELAAHWRVVLADPFVRACGRSLSDIRDVELTFIGTDLAAALRGVMAPNTPPGGWRIALLVSRPIEMGIARQLQLLAGALMTARIFTDETEATAWLLSDEA